MAAPSLRLPSLPHRCAMLALWLASPWAAADDAPAEAAKGAVRSVVQPAEEHAEEAAERSVLIPAAEIVTFDFLLSRYNRRFSGLSDYDVSGASIRRNLRGPWVTDNDPFRINQFAHPYQGSLYHGAGRSAGLNYWQASALTFAGSAWWEITGEKTPPSRNDQVASGVAGSFLGEPLFRMAHLLLGPRSSAPGPWRDWGAAVLSPGLGVNRLLFGSRFDSAFSDHDPSYFSRLRVGANHVTHDVGTTANVKANDATLDFAIDYGQPGSPGYTYTRPFDHFNLQATISSANGVQVLTTRGLLWGTDHAIGDSYRGIWGLYAGYDYIAPQLFQVSSTSLSLGTTGQWWWSKDVSLQGTGLGGISYVAASTRNGSPDDRDYHYGTAPRIGLALRLTVGHRVSADVTGEKYFLGRIANRAAGSDDVTRTDTALSWRVTGRHAIGMKYAWSHRSANYPTLGNRSQTLATVGVFYTLLGEEDFGGVDWRGSTGR